MISFFMIYKKESFLARSNLDKIKSYGSNMKLKPGSILGWKESSLAISLIVVIKQKQFVQESEWLLYDVQDGDLFLANNIWIGTHLRILQR